VTDAPDDTARSPKGDRVQRRGAVGASDVRTLGKAIVDRGSLKGGSRIGARIEVRKLGKAYIHSGQALPVLRDVDLILEPGDMVAVVGASGVGKSTLLQILGTLDLPTSGSIKFDGHELTQLSSAMLADFRNRRIGFVFQFHHLLPEFTAVENVMMPALIQKMPVAKARTMAKDILGRVGLGHRLTHRPSELSGGEQQRVALARAMVLGPSLLLADEPTGNLDRSTGEAIHQLFLDLNTERGSTLLVVTHNPELARLMPRRMRMIDGGRLVEESETGYRGTIASEAVSPGGPPPEVRADIERAEQAAKAEGEAADAASGKDAP
jgi:lipoprotein-releasing system ATP-binding protein